MENNDDDYIKFDIDNCKFSDSNDDDGNIHFGTDNCEESNDDDDGNVHFDIGNCKFKESDEEYVKRLASMICAGSNEIHDYDKKDRYKRFPLLAWREYYNRTHGITESSGSYNGERLTLAQILKKERMSGHDIPKKALIEFLRLKKIKPKTDHTYHKSVRDVIAKNRGQLNDIIQRQNGVNAASRNAAQSPQRPTVADRTYAPRKGLSRASMELLKGDDIAYNGEKKDESKTMRKEYLVRLTESDLHRIVKESVNRILSENAHDYWGDAEYKHSKRERLPKGWEKVEREDDEPIYRDEDCNEYVKDEYGKFTPCN